ncbi:MAG: protein phosphatase CheZ [Desulfobulbaceae bacterium]|nr:protein phosphatase CheZ [Desulfobulbaceae bacterium]
MGKDISEVDKILASLVDVTDSLLRGDYNRAETEKIDPEGLLSTLTQKINTMVVNLKTVQSPLASAGEQAPNVVMSAQDVVELMRKTAGDVLDKSDRLMLLGGEMESYFEQAQDVCPDIVGPAKEKHSLMQEAIFDIIAAQSFQDVARQKMERVIKDLTQIRDWLIEALVILNLRNDDSPENIEQKAELLREVSEAKTSEGVKQDLVDDLLAEFGF